MKHDIEIEINEILNEKIEEYFKKRKENYSNLLFIDGGGTKGVFASEIFEIMGKDNYEEFNIVSGTSIGGVLALAYEVVAFDQAKETTIRLLKKTFNINWLQKIINITLHEVYILLEKLKGFWKNFLVIKRLKI
ncbi:MAG: patatin-like phospholipase family protein [Mycoplasmatales bacterium]|nr:patatin-like phospholipase family protein [Mycoplasmatales bacterium]